MRTDSLEAAIRFLRAESEAVRRPIAVGIDGGSGSGKTTIAEHIHRKTASTLINLDDFYTTQIPETEWPKYSVAERLPLLFDWQRVRNDVLIPLLNGEFGKWQPFDFVSGLGADGTYGLQTEFVEAAPSDIILIEGLGTCSPELADLLDVKVLVDTPLAERHARMAARDDAKFLARWHQLWDDYVEYYLTEISPKDSFDMIIPN